MIYTEETTGIKRISVMGSTGSIGTQTLDIVRGRSDFRVTGLSAGRNIALLEKQVREFRPSFVCVEREEDAKVLREKLADLDVKVASGMSGLIELAQSDEAELFVTAIVGMRGISPTLAAIGSGKDIALANKETLVCAGHLIMPLAKQRGVSILPVDSEHSAIYQCLQGCRRDREGRLPIENIWLTASGGPFLGKTAAELADVTLADALNHPNWSMGSKVTIDSSTLVNKGLEVMEAHWLFDTDYDHIKVVIQPKSIIHSMVEFRDGSVMAQMGVPDMHLPIAYAIKDRQREELPYGRLDFTTLSSIEFRKPDTDTFKGLPLAFRAGKRGGTLPTVFNAADEAAVALFMRGKIKYLDIYEVISSAMDAHKVIDDPSTEEILEAGREAVRFVEERYGRP